MSKTKGFVDICKAASEGTTNRVRLKEDRFLAMQILLPSLEEQQRIVRRIEELSAKIEEARGLRRTTQAELLSLRNAAFQNLFGSEFPKTHLENICSLITNGTHLTPNYVEDGMPFLSAQNIKPYRFMLEVHRKVSIEDFQQYTARVKASRGDVLMTRVGAGIGEAAIIDRDMDFAFYVSVALIKPLPKLVFTPYLVHWLNSPQGRDLSKSGTLGRGNSQGNLNLKLIRNFQIPLPTIAEQRSIVTCLDDIQSKIDAIKKLQSETAEELNALLPSVLDKAFKGEL